MEEKTLYKISNGSVYLEFLRILAIVFVIFSTTDKYGYMLYATKDPGSFQFGFELFFSIFSKFAIPMFFAISGAVMLAKEDESLGHLFYRILNIIIPLIVFSFIYYLKDLNYETSNFSFNYFVSKLYSNGLNSHLLFLYAYIVYLLSLPFLRAMVCSLKEKYFIYMMILGFIVEGIIPYAEYLLANNNIQINYVFRNLWFLSYIILYPSIGYYFHVCFKPQFSSVFTANALIVDFLLINFSIFMTYAYGIENVQAFDTEIFHNNFTIINVITLFMTVKCICFYFNLSVKSKIILRFIGKSCLGIYLLYPILKDSSFMQSFISWLYKLNINQMICAIIICAALFLSSLLITTILSIVPCVKKIVGF